MDRPALSRALASVASQDAPGIDAEVLVVAACGRAHKPVAPKTGPFGTRLVVASDGGRLTRPQAGNAGLDAASGEYIAFLDDDDELMPHQFRTLLSEFDADPAAQFVHARSQAVDPQGNPLYLYGGPWHDWEQLTTGFFQLGAVMFRRGLLDKGVRFDESLDILEDLEFFVQCARHAKLRYRPDPVSRYYVMDGDSGTGEGGNRDDARVQRALGYIRDKWRDLAAELDDLPPARIHRGREQVLRGEFAAAIETLAPVLETQPGEVNALNLSGLAHINVGNFAEAEVLLRRALAVVPGHPGIEKNLALLARRRAGT
ncbi:glycosyltransferase [Usitatibacter palustris]|nr:glycosyltransferase [Usitatibacter palustris]